MPKSWRYTLSIICIIILAAVLWRSPEKDKLLDTLGNTAKESQNRYPNAIMDNTNTRQFSRSGALEFILTTEKILFFEQSSANPQPFAEYQKPVFIFYGNAQGRPIKLVSDTAYSRDDGNTIELKNNVSLTQTLTNGEQYQLTTDALTILPSTQFAETDKPVIITQPNGVTTATGLKADLKQQRFELLSNVRGNYVQ